VQQLHRQQEGTRDVAELLVLAGRAHVEHDGPQGEELLRLLGGDVLVASRAAVYIGGQRGHDGPIIGPARGRASARDHEGGSVGVAPRSFALAAG
jgi:hypothetical protein